MEAFKGHSDLQNARFGPNLKSAFLRARVNIRVLESIGYLKSGDGLEMILLMEPLKGLRASPRTGNPLRGKIPGEATNRIQELFR
jgi:hypothetical protein